MSTVLRERSVVSVKEPVLQGYPGLAVWETFLSIRGAGGRMSRRHVCRVIPPARLLKSSEAWAWSPTVPALSHAQIEMTLPELNIFTDLTQTLHLKQTYDTDTAWYSMFNPTSMTVADRSLYGKVMRRTYGFWTLRQTTVAVGQ